MNRFHFLKHRKQKQSLLNIHGVLKRALFTIRHPGLCKESFDFNELDFWYLSEMTTKKTSGIHLPSFGFFSN